MNARTSLRQTQNYTNKKPGTHLIVEVIKCDAIFVQQFLHVPRDVSDPEFVLPFGVRMALFVSLADLRHRQVRCQPIAGFTG